MSKKDAKCDRCGDRAIIGWSCPACQRYMCPVCSGQASSKPKDMGGFTAQYSAGPGSCPYCSKKWWQFWK